MAFSVKQRKSKTIEAAEQGSGGTVLSKGPPYADDTLVHKLL